MTFDAWNPKTFSADILAALSASSALIRDHQIEDRKLMDEHLHSSRYRSIKPNRFSPAYQDFKENTLAPIIARSRLRAWHYTRLTDEETDEIHRKLESSSLEYLQHRLNNLVAKGLLTKEDAATVFSQSPFHEQFDIRVGQLCATTIPLPYYDSGVTPLLESWGGESAYFWLTDLRIAAILKRIGRPRIVEIETNLTDEINGYKVAETVLIAWTRKLGVPATLQGSDLFVTKCIETAKVLRVHTQGDGFFENVGTTYPQCVGPLVEN